MFLSPGICYIENLHSKYFNLRSKNMFLVNKQFKERIYKQTN